MVNTQLKILRVFGPTGAEVSSVLRGIRDDGCPGLRLLERDGEFAICVQVSAPNRAMAEQYCDKWAARLRAKFGDDVFAEGETSLAQATLDALLEKRKLLVAVDEPTVPRRHCAGRSGPCAGRAAGHRRGLRCRLHARQRRAVPLCTGV